ncbi:MAG: PspC domain-containing protein [Actinomycetota bacterium]
MTTSNPHPAPPAPKRLVRDPDGMIGGVASGFADYVGVDVTIIRLALVAAFVIGGGGLLLYLIAWIVIPKGDGRTPPPPEVPPAASGSGEAAWPAPPAPSSAAE